MSDYAIGRCSRRCRVSDRALEPGERYYSVVISQGGETTRLDVSETHWSGPPEGAIGWWRSTMAHAKPRRVLPTPNAVLVERLAELCDDPAQASLAYLLGILLVRRRVLQLDTDDVTDDPSQGLQCLKHPVTDHRSFGNAEVVPRRFEH